MVKHDNIKATQRQPLPALNLAAPYNNRTAQLTTQCPPDVERFIREALTKRKSSLIRFAAMSQSVTEMAKYLKRHCSQSHATAYLYT